MKQRVLVLIIFGVAFGFVEAVVVLYLRHIFHYTNTYVHGSYAVLLKTGIISFISPKVPILDNVQITLAETQREMATIIMLLSVAFVSSSNWKQRLGAFFITFAFWDIFYYVFLSYLTGWPKSIFDIDVYFLIPVTWIGPVITPVIVSIILAILGIRLYTKSE